VCLCVCVSVCVIRGPADEGHCHICTSCYGNDWLSPW